MTSQQNVSEKMKTVKAACDKAPAGPKKEAALKHYQTAQQSQKDKKENQAIRELDQATKALL
jgi:hypothetical protein